MSPDLDDELIPTAIVIKNIPFAVKKEQLVQLMTDLRLPLPYAFNYHFDNGVFRGLAFANFTTADETAAVIETMNHFELQGRKLRVEYKKMLPLAERERIEREKRERRGQLEEQHRPMLSMHNQPSMSSLSSHLPTSTPSPLSAKGPKLGEWPDSLLFCCCLSSKSLEFIHDLSPKCNCLVTDHLRLTNFADYDLNDPQVLQFYSQLLLFKEDASRDTMSFPSTLTPQQRRIVHTLSHQMGLMHISKGTGEQRQVHIIRTHEMPNLSPPVSQLSAQDSQRRALSRAATTDFSDVRGSEMFGAGAGAGPGPGAGALGRQSSGFLGFLESPGGGGGGGGGPGPGGMGGAGLSAGMGAGGVGGLLAGQNLRAAKSFADLRSYTPSPVPSTASFPATLSTNFSRFNDHGLGQQGGYGHGPSSMSQGHGHTLNSAGAGSSNAGSLSAGAVGSGRDDEGRSVPSLVNGLSNMTIGPGFGPGSAGSPRGLRGVMSWDRDHWEKDRDGSFFSSNSNNNNTSSGNVVGSDMGNVNSAGGSTNPGPIGGHRSMSTHLDEHNPSQSQGQQQQQQQHQSSMHHSFPLQQQHQSFPSSSSQPSLSNGGGGGSSARLPGERTLGHQSSMPLRQSRGPPGILSVPERGSLTGSSSSSTLKTSTSGLGGNNSSNHGNIGSVATPTGSTSGGSSGFGSGRTGGLGVVGAGLGTGSGNGNGDGDGNSNNNNSNNSNNIAGSRQQQQNGHGGGSRLRGSGDGNGEGGISTSSLPLPSASASAS